MSKSSKKKRKRLPRVPPPGKKKMKAGQVTASIQELLQRFNFIWQDYTILKMNFEALLWLQHRAWWFRWIPVLNALIDIWWMSDRMIRWAGNRLIKKQMAERDKAESEQRKVQEEKINAALEAEDGNEYQNRLIRNGVEVDDTPPEGTKVDVEEPDVNEHKLNPELTDEEIMGRHETTEVPSPELVEKGSVEEKGDFEKRGSVEEEEIIKDSELNAVASV